MKYNNYDITKIYYSGYTITKVMGCGGLTVFEENPSNHYKLYYENISGQTGTIQCNSATTLTSGETKSVVIEPEGVRCFT